MTHQDFTFSAKNGDHRPLLEQGVGGKKGQSNVPRKSSKYPPRFGNKQIHFNTNPEAYLIHPRARVHYPQKVYVDARIRDGHIGVVT